MPKYCINCGKPINGVGQNKVFCNDCLQKVTPFFKFIGKSKVPAAKLFELNLEKLKSLGFSELALKYIEKCCIKLDEKRAAAAPSSKTTETAAPSPVKDGNQAPESASAILSAAISASIPAENEAKTGPTALKSDEFSKIPKEISSEEIVDLHISEEKEPQKEKKTVEYGTSAAISAAKIPKNEYGAPDDTSDIGDEYDDDDDLPEDEVSSQKRIILIIAAAITAFVIFLSLYLSGILPSYTPNLDKDSTPDTVINTSPAADTETDAPETDNTTDPDTTETVFVCTHEWEDATCVTPKTCTVCGETGGDVLGHEWHEATCTTPTMCIRCMSIEADALGHDWSEATCTKAQTCALCGETNGAPIDHNFRYDADENDNVCTYCKKTQASITGVRACDHDWTEADCDSAKTCTRCGDVDGDILGHNWQDATCSAPKTCSRCSITEGEALTHNFVDATCTSPSACSYCGLTEGEALGHVTDGVKCSRCGGYLVSISSVGTLYDDPSGLSVFVESIEGVTTETGKIYYVKYTVTNNSPDSTLEGAFKLFLEEGGGIDPPGVAYETLYPGASLTHTYTFEVPADKTPLILEYYSDGGVLLFRSQPHTTADALYWALPQ